jgi:hypothetical protein
VSSTAGVEEVVSAGVDVVAHVPANAELDRALVERMAEARVVVGPTLATVENTLGEPGGAAVAGDQRLAEALGDAWVRRLTSNVSGSLGREMPPYSQAEDNVRRLADAGVALLAATDAPNPGTVFGARSWQPCANAGPTDPGKASLNAGPVVVRALAKACFPPAASRTAVRAR